MSIKFFKVGGAVRDSLMGLKPKDVDFAVEAPSWDAMREAIIARGGKIFLETPKYFTIRANVPDLGAADYVLCRKDGEYKDGRHPETVEVGTIADDLARRDFTCNAIAVDMDSLELVDPHCGQHDIDRKLLCAVGDATKRLAEDRLRAFRAVRFAVTKGFRIDAGLSFAISELQDFSSVSTERIRDELLKMFAVDTHKSFVLLSSEYPVLWRIVLERGIWFKPTVEKI